MIHKYIVYFCEASLAEMACFLTTTPQSGIVVPDVEKRVLTPVPSWRQEAGLTIVICHEAE
jgi:hypothetical protein